ncbi:unnamed protein product [Allacma fusca]|uniref:Uncharacterized protein n=1 Tax=Allacma fusca TaxID=39272 RepID=A0A8J2J9X8_9HEXA|nr:unnamed protein product [Allacma fusca]
MNANLRPICAIALATLVYFIRQLWRHRIRPEVLIDPPDCEDWVNLSTYDLEKSAVDFGKSVFVSWVTLRSDHYFMWVILTSVFWITLAKVSCLVSFPAILFVMSNGVFIAFPVLKSLKLNGSRRSPVDTGEDDPPKDGATAFPESEMRQMSSWGKRQ